MATPPYNYTQPPVITQPPGPMAPPGQQPMMIMTNVQQPTIPGCPPGLEYLATVDQLLVKQQVELAEVLCGCEMNNKYKIMNTMGQDVFFAREETDCCTRNCCGSLRPFELMINDNFDNEVLHLSRPLRCQGCCCPCCLQELVVSSPRNQAILGYVQEVWSCCTPTYSILNGAKDPVFKIEGPICTCKCCSDVNFKIFAKDGETKVGVIQKQWTGIVREAFTDADNFNVSFPLDLDISMKATLLGALFLIDFMYFEDQQAKGGAD